MHSIVIPTCGSYEKHLKVCIDSIFKNTIIEDKEFIIVANGSNKEIIHYVHSLPKNFELLWCGERMGVTKAFNAGCKAATSEFITLMNDDLVLLDQPMNEWIDRMLLPMADEKVGMTGTITKDASTGLEFVISYCCTIRKKVFEEVGYFDEIFNPYYGEDVDLCLRAKKAGWKYGYADMNIYHPWESDLTQSPERKAIIQEKINILKERYPNNGN